MMEINILFSMSGQMHAMCHGGGPGADELGFVLNFTLHQVYPESRVHQAFAEYLKRNRVSGIVPRRHYCEIDLNSLRLLFPNLLKAAWIRGHTRVEPEVTVSANQGAIGLRATTGIALRVIREEVILSQRNRIFLSHKSSNKTTVRRFYDVLAELGFEPWLDDEDMAAGDNLHRGLLEGMSSSCAAIFFITPQFADERYLAHEIELAVREKTERGDEFRIITLSLADETGQRGEVPALLRTYIFKEPDSELGALRQILRGLPLRVGPVERDRSG